jgi:hypothetical protein
LRCSLGPSSYSLAPGVLNAASFVSLSQRWDLLQLVFALP